MRRQKKQVKIPVIQIFLRASVVFAVFFVLLFSVFVSAAKLPVSKTVLKPTTVAAGGVYKTTVSKAASDKLKNAEICRGKIKRTCKLIAKNIRGVKISVLIPANYPVGDAAIKITYKDENKKNILVINKEIKVISSNSGSGGGGGGGSSSSSSSGGSSASSSLGSTVNSTGSSATPTPINSPSPTPQVSTDGKPILVSH